jgi:hypothetical protein
MEHARNNPKWWRYLARLFLILDIFVVFFFFLFLWAKKSYVDQGDIILAFYLSFLLGASLVLAVLAVIGLMLGFFLKYKLRVYLMMFNVSLLPIFFLNVC